jgi:hypothetical protein
VLFRSDTGVITATSLDISGGADIDGNLSIGLNEDIDPDSSGSGQLMIDGVGYSAYVALNDSAMNIGHNSSSRNLTFQTNETTRMSIDGSGVTTIQNSGNALLQLISESSDGDSVSAVTLTRNNNSNQVANLGVRDNEDVFRITVGSNVGPSFANLGNFTRLAINATGTALFNSSVGVGKIGANVLSMTTGTTITVQDNDGSANHVYVYDRGSGSGAIYQVGYAFASSIVVSAGGYGFGTSLGGSHFNLVSSANSHTITFQNNTGVTRNVRIFMVSAGTAVTI